MSAVRREDRSWPTRDERLLLAAGVSRDDSDALRAWRAWRATNALDPIEPTSYRLLPLAYRRLAGLDVDPRDLFHLKNVYRYEWYANQMLMRRAAGVLRRFAAAGIPTLVLKGAALQALQYRDAGTRPMDDVDVLVPTADAARAVDLLLAAGWKPTYLRPHDRIAVHHSQPFDHPDDGSVDLHWHALHQPADEADFWEAAVPVVIGGVDTLAPCATDQLLHVCVHGRPWGVTPSMRWVADALAVVRGDDGVDWDRLVLRARARGVTLELREALSYLAETFGADVPPATLGALAGIRPTLTERAAHGASTRLPPPSQVRTLVTFWDRWRRLGAVDPPYARPARFDEYVYLYFGFTGPRPLLAEAVRRRVGRGRSASARGYRVT